MIVSVVSDEHVFCRSCGLEIYDRGGEFCSVECKEQFYDWLDRQGTVRFGLQLTQETLNDQD